MGRYKLEIKQRNIKIKKDYQQGKRIDKLADSYCLSVYSIKKIIYQK